MPKQLTINERLERLRRKLAKEKFNPKELKKIENEEKAIQAKINYRKNKKDGTARAKRNSKEYAILMEEQFQSCAICEYYIKKKGGKTHWDHCHTTGKYRGLLCSNCNVGLGFFRDNVYILQSAIDYLNKWKELHKDVGLPDVWEPLPVDKL